MVSGYVDDDVNRKYQRAYKFATITIVGDHAPLILGIDPVKENSN